MVRSLWHKRELSSYLMLLRSSILSLSIEILSIITSFLTTFTIISGTTRYRSVLVDCEGIGFFWVMQLPTEPEGGNTNMWWTYSLPDSFYPLDFYIFIPHPPFPISNTIHPISSPFYLSNSYRHPIPIHTISPPNLQLIINFPTHTPQNQFSQLYLSPQTIASQKRTCFCGLVRNPSHFTLHTNEESSTYLLDTSSSLLMPIMLNSSFQVFQLMSIISSDTMISSHAIHHDRPWLEPNFPRSFG